MANKKDLKAYIRYDGNGRVIPGALLLNRFKPSSGGKWHEIPAYECCNSTPALRLTFVDFSELGGLGILDPTDVGQWNSESAFNLPANGNPFTSVSVSGYVVSLYGGSDISLSTIFGGISNLISVIDEIGCILDVPIYGFDSCYDLTTVNLPACTAIGDGAFGYCTSLVTVYLPLAVNIGSTVGDNDVFVDIIGNTMTVTIPASVMTADAGNPDGDIVYLQANNTVTVVTV